MSVGESDIAAAAVPAHKAQRVVVFVIGDLIRQVVNDDAVINISHDGILRIFEDDSKVGWRLI